MNITKLPYLTFAAVLYASTTGIAQDAKTPQAEDTAILEESYADELDSRIQRIKSLISADAQMEYLWSQELDLDGEPGSIQSQQLNIKTPLYYHKLSDDWAVSLGLNYTGTWLETNGIENIADNDHYLSEIGLPVTFIGSTTDRNWFFIGRVAPTLGTDFESDISDGIDFYAWGGAMYNFNDKLALGVGGYYSHRYGDDFLIGGVGFIYLINDHWSTGYIGPRYIVDYEHSENWHITAQAEFPGDRWRLNGDGDIGTDGLLDVDNYSVSVISEHRISKSRDLYLTLRIGYQFGGELEARDANDIVVSDKDLEGGVFAGIGLRYYAW